MKKPHVLLKLAAIVSALLLASGLVAYRAGAFNKLIRSKQSEPNMLPSSKVGKILVPITPETQDAQSSDPAKPGHTFMGGSKSIDTPTLVPNPLVTPPNIPSAIDDLPVK